MANFAPLKQYMLRHLGSLIARYGVVGPFADLGTGSGDVARWLAERGWRGIAVEGSPRAAAVASTTLRPCPTVELIIGPIETLAAARTGFGLVLLWDVIEHLPNDADTVRLAANMLQPGGHLCITVPSHPREWRWDDEFYGHLRRYEPSALDTLVRSAGLEVLEMRDLTFPVFWIMRRIYTRLKNPPRIAPLADATLDSALQSSWEMGILSNIAAWPVWWRPLFSVSDLAGNPERGHELIALARKPVDAMDSRQPKPGHCHTPDPEPHRRQQGPPPE